MVYYTCKQHLYVNTREHISDSCHCHKYIAVLFTWITTKKLINRYIYIEQNVSFFNPNYF